MAELAFKKGGRDLYQMHHKGNSLEQHSASLSTPNEGRSRPALKHSLPLLSRACAVMATLGSSSWIHQQEETAAGLLTGIQNHLVFGDHWNKSQASFFLVELLLLMKEHKKLSTVPPSDCRATKEDRKVQGTARVLVLVVAMQGMSCSS